MSLLPTGRSLQRSDLAALPDDGRRYELLDGSLLVTPSPTLRHQVAAFELAYRLRLRCPADLYVLTAPADVVLAADTVLQPDVLVLERSAIIEDDQEFAPLLVVEVLSPSTRRIDRTLKKARYESAGVPAYWIVDADEPSLTAWTLSSSQPGDRASYGEPVTVTGSQVFDATTPFTFSVAPQDLRI